MKSFSQAKNPENNPINEVLIVVPHIQRSFKQCTKIFVEKIVFSLFSFSFIHKKTRKMQLTFFCAALIYVSYLIFLQFRFFLNFFFVLCSNNSYGIVSHIPIHHIPIYTNYIFIIIVYCYSYLVLQVLLLNFKWS